MFDSGRHGWTAVNRWMAVNRRMAVNPVRPSYSAK